MGLTIDMYRPAASALVADLVPAAGRTRAYGLIFWAVNLGFSVAMVLGGARDLADGRWCRGLRRLHRRAPNGMVIVVLQPLAGAWLARRDHATAIASGIGFLGLGFRLTALAATTWEYAACVAIWTIGEILTNSTAAALIAALAPPRLRGRYNGVFGLAFSLGYLIAPLVGTRLLARGRPVLWLSCAGACDVAAAWQLALGPAIRRRELVAGAGATDRSV